MRLYLIFNQTVLRNKSVQQGAAQRRILTSMTNRDLNPKKSRTDAQSVSPSCIQRKTKNFYNDSGKFHANLSITKKVDKKN